MSYMHLGKRNQLIWDGLELGITEKSYSGECPYCRSVISYSIKDISGIATCENEFIAYLVNSKIISSVQGRFEVKKGIPAYTVKHCCSNCKNNFWLIIGLKEIQPQRYNIFYKSSVYKKKL